jgi:hypothetical protein
MTSAKAVASTGSSITVTAEIDRAPAAVLSFSSHDGGEDSSVGATGIGIEWDCFESGFNTLQSYGGFARVTRGMHPRHQFGQPDGSGAGLLRRVAAYTRPRAGRPTSLRPDRGPRRQK